MQNTSTIEKIKSSLSELTGDQVNAEICRRSFFYFVQQFWETVIAEEPIWNWHIKYLCDELQEIGKRVARREAKEFDYFIINVPPGSSKSTVVSEMYPLWCWTIDPSQRFICGSYASTPAEDIADKCFRIYKSEKFQRLFPHLVQKSSGGKTHFQNGLKGERYTTSTGSAVTGIHAHQKIVDDPMNPQIAASRLERERANKWLSETLGSRDVSAIVTVTIVVMQRLHQMDSTGYILNKAKEGGLRVKHVCLPATLTDDVKPEFLKEKYEDNLLDPIRLPSIELATKKIKLGSYGYAGQMQQRPSPEEGGIIKKDWFNITKRPLPTPIEATINFQMDTAYTKDEANDPTGIAPYYVLNGNLYITHASCVYKEFPELIRWIPPYVKEHGYRDNSMIHVEPKASGKSVVQTVKAGTSLNIIESEPPKVDKLTLLHIASPKVEAGRVFLHEGPWNEAFIEQVCSFPNDEHDEYVDILSAIIRRELMDDSDFDYEQLNSIL